MIFVSKLSCFLPSRGRHFGSNIAEKPVQVEDNKLESESWIYLRKFCLFFLPFEVGLKFVLADNVLIQVLSLTTLVVCQSKLCSNILIWLCCNWI